ncbi:MAG: GNAT family N-acetyltransferase [Clostridia bacterium]|nr:GNAT family N-acetyltransferase [Clostridia bacterium]
MKAEFRKINAFDVPYLELLLYETVFVLDDEPMPDRSVLETERYKKYIHPWHDEDIGYIAIDSMTSEAIGAVWLKFFTKDAPGEAYINDKLPELTIVIDGAYRNKGIGTDLVHYLMAQLPASVHGICLSVDVRDPALDFFERLGFVAFKVEKTNVILRYDRH